jgi:hypothetical protein
MGKQVTIERGEVMVKQFATQFGLTNLGLEGQITFIDLGKDSRALHVVPTYAETTY